MRLVLVTSCALLLCACGNDLPNGWEDAVRADVRASACGGEQPGAAGLQASPRQGGIDLLARQVPFRCEQEVEAWVRAPEDGVVEVLFQPVEMNPGSVARCDCVYDLQTTFEAASGSQKLTVFRRPDNYGMKGENLPIQVGTAIVPVP